MRKIVQNILLFLLIINVSYALAGIFFYPIKSIDALAIWLFKGKAIYLDNGLLSQILKLPKYFYSSPDYPLLLPFLFSIIYKLAGGIREIYVLLLYPFFYSAILILVYKTLKGKTTTTVALFFTYLYSMLSPLLAQAGRGLAGNADIVLVFFSWLIIYLVFTRPSKNFIFYISVIAAVSSQIKTEGLFLATPLLFLPNSRCRKISFLSLAVFPFIFWIIMTKIIIVTPFTRFFIPSFAQLLPRIFIIFSGLIKEMLNVKNWYIFWPIFSLCLFIKNPLSKITKEIIANSLLVMSFFFFIVYLFSTTPLGDYVSCSIDRVLFQLSPWFFILFFEKTNSEVLKFIINKVPPYVKVEP